MNNTQLRLISAFAMLLTVIAVVYLGTLQSLLFLVGVGVICIDEIYTNFLKKERFSLGHITAEAAFILPFVYLNLIDKSFELNNVLVNLGLLTNILLIIYLFFTKMDSFLVKNTLTKYSFLISLLVLPSLCSIAAIFYYGKWVGLITVLIAINFGMDTGAWFFGKNFGKNKLWPSVSPNKTIEGLVGGCLVSAISGIIAWNLFVGYSGFSFFIPFMIMGLFSQMGDLIQSKMKRQFEIKDSSQLIPGHGGVYDRIDSLVFVAPFFATFVSLINL